MTNKTPVGSGDLWLSKRGTKGAVVVLVGDHLLTIASVRMLHMSFL